jgi:site-specific DNA recombinase
MKLRKVIQQVALYARVSGERQVQEATIDSQVAALRQRITQDGFPLDEELCFVDDGYRGHTLIRPALERLRDQAANGAFDRLYVYDPDRLARQYAYQCLLVDELQQAGIDVVFLNRPLGSKPEDQLLLQMQGVFAEYERAKILERSRRGRLHAARQGQVSVLAAAPYGYRYVGKQEGGGVARYDVIFEEARVVQQMFAWVGQDRLSLREVGRRLQQQGVRTRTGKADWNPATIAYLLQNPAYRGQAGYGKSRVIERQPRLRPRRDGSATPRRPFSVTRQDTEPLFIPVPALISDELFAAVAEQLAENRQRQRCRRAQAQYLLQGLVVCKACGYAWHGLTRRQPRAAGSQPAYIYRHYRCGGKQVTTADGEKSCHVRDMRCSALDESVWQDVCRLLADPARIEEEYARRLGGEAAAEGQVPGLAKVIGHVKKMIARLIDSYSAGLIEREEFEPRIRRARERLAQLEAEAASQAEEEAQRAELRLVLGGFQDFAERIKDNLGQADWQTRREIIRALVRRVEIDDEEVRIVYRITAVPFVESPAGGILQDCWKRHVAFFSQLLLLDKQQGLALLAVPPGAGVPPPWPIRISCTSARKSPPYAIPARAA